MSDVLMYWQPTPVLGVFDTELPQFTILGFETNDRQVSLKTNNFLQHVFGFRMDLNIFLSVSSHSFFLVLLLQGTIGNWRVSTFVAVVQTSSKYWLFCVSNLFAKYSHCDVVVGIILDKS